MTDVGTLWDPEDPVGTERRLREAAEGADAEERLVLMTRVAHALTLQGDHQRAL